MFGGVLAKHPPRWNAFVESRSRQFGGGVGVFETKYRSVSESMVRRKRHYGSSATTLLLADNGHMFRRPRHPLCDRNYSPSIILSK